MRRIRNLGFSLIATCTLAAAGCGGGNKNDMGGNPDMTMPPPEEDMTMTPMDDLTMTPQPDLTMMAPDMATRPKNTVYVGAMVPGGNDVNRFFPLDLTINHGETVTWLWTGTHHHNVISGKAGAPDGKFCLGDKNCTMPAMVPTQTTGTYQHTFMTAGTYTYYCYVHMAVMSGTITVK